MARLGRPLRHHIVIGDSRRQVRAEGRVFWAEGTA